MCKNDEAYWGNEGRIMKGLIHQRYVDFPWKQWVTNEGFEEWELHEYTHTICAYLSTMVLGVFKMEGTQREEAIGTNFTNGGKNFILAGMQALWGQDTCHFLSMCPRTESCGRMYT